jgi:hypothetical protein
MWSRTERLQGCFEAPCHAEAHHRGVKAGQPPVPCLHCGRSYVWHVKAEVYWQEGAV